MVIYSHIYEMFNPRFEFLLRQEGSLVCPKIRALATTRASVAYLREHKQGTRPTYDLRVLLGLPSIIVKLLQDGLPSCPDEDELVDVEVPQYSDGSCQVE